MRGAVTSRRGVVVALVAGALAWLAPMGGARAQSGRSVSMGRPGDHWASMLAYTYIGRGERDGVYGYEVKLRAADGCEVKLFYPRAAIDFHGRGRAWTLFEVRVATGWLSYPSRLTARSVPLPRATRPAPAPRTRMSRAARSTSANTARAATSAVKQLPRGINPRSVVRGLSNRNLKHLRKHLPEFQKLDPRMTAEKVRELGASLVRPEPRDAGSIRFERGGNGYEVLRVEAGRR